MFKVYGKSLCLCHCRSRIRTISVPESRAPALVKVCYISHYPKVVTDTKLRPPKDELTSLDVLVDKVRGKITYNSVLTHINLSIRWKVRKQIKEESIKAANQEPIPLSLKYLMEDETSLKFLNKVTGNPTFEEIPEVQDESDINLPYKAVRSEDIRSEDWKEEADDENSSLGNYTDDEDMSNRISDNVAYKPGKKIWFSDYECYEETKEGDFEDIPQWSNYYGTSDTSIPVSRVPCGGCGAFLHCQNPSIPGYLPKELFGPCAERDLKVIVCQRCHFMNTYNTAIDVTIDAKFYPQLIETLKTKRALIVLMVDMTDYPCSIWPGILELIGEEKPLVIVGNKIDLIHGDSYLWLNQAQKSLREALPDYANIKHVQLISAKTGYGVESLITKLYSIWQTKGDVYIVGCTNVGKSTLFNALLRSDYCKIQAVDLIQRATTSRWPGTTLNLLKFPVQRPSGWKLYIRTQRLKMNQLYREQERELEKVIDSSKNMKMPEIIGHIGRTFGKDDRVAGDDMFTADNIKLQSAVTSGVPFDETEKIYKRTKWCYDTPGVVHPDQITDLLTTEELIKVVPDDTLKPRILRVMPEQTLFIAGLARIDLLEGPYLFRTIVYAPKQLPITICPTQYADDVYDTLLGSDLFAVPFGSKKRLDEFPKLKPAPDFDFIGFSTMEICLELVLSNAGWVSFVSEYGAKCKVRAWTPDARGIHERKEPLLKYTPRLCRSRIQNTPVQRLRKFQST